MRDRQDAHGHADHPPARPAVGPPGRPQRQLPGDHPLPRPPDQEVARRAGGDDPGRQGDALRRGRQGLQAPDHRHDPALGAGAGSRRPLAEAPGGGVVHPGPRPGQVPAGPLRPRQQADGLRLGPRPARRQPQCRQGGRVAGRYADDLRGVRAGHGARRCPRWRLVSPVPGGDRRRRWGEAAGGLTPLGLPVLRQADRRQERRPHQRPRLVEAHDLRRQVRAGDPRAGPEGERPGSVAAPEATGRGPHRAASSRRRASAGGSASATSRSGSSRPSPSAGRRRCSSPRRCPGRSRT